MSYLALLEHWQTEHDGWDAERVLIWSYADWDPDIVTSFRAALGVDEDATHSDIHELVTTSGRPRCSCGKDPTPDFDTQPRYAIIGDLVRAVSLLFTVSFA